MASLTKCTVHRQSADCSSQDCLKARSRLAKGSEKKPSKAAVESTVGLVYQVQGALERVWETQHLTAMKLEQATTVRLKPLLVAAHDHRLSGASQKLPFSSALERLHTGIAGWPGGAWLTRPVSNAPSTAVDSGA